MPIPRLAPATSPLDINITINTKLRPYLTQWYQDTKLEDETPEEFILRHLKGIAVNYYSRPEIRNQAITLDSDKEAEVQALRDDADLLLTEVD